MRAASRRPTTTPGRAGSRWTSGFQKLLFALKFKEKNVLLSSALTKDSKLMYIRKPAERVAKVAPFLKLDARPVPGGRSRAS